MNNSHGFRRRSGVDRIVLCFVLAGCFGVVTAQESAVQPLGEVFEKQAWRGIGPAVMSGRIVDVEVPAQDRNRVVVAAASGGIWLSENRGVTWRPIFDEAKTQTLGDIAIAPSDPQTLWAGTGEANNQRSSYAGAGVFKSSDGGKTWQGLGLKESHHIGRIVIHPTNPDVVYFAVLGHLYTTNPERGVYRTMDGGRSFEHVLAVDPRTGAVDLVMDPQNPLVLYAATYERLRRPWHLTESGPGSGLWKTVDGGAQWKRLAGGFPDGEIGRIGLAISARNTNTLFACVENRNPAEAAPKSESTETRSASEPRESGEESEEAEDAEAEERAAEAEAMVAPPPKVIGGEIYRSDDGGASWHRVNEKPVAGDPPYYYGQIRVDPVDDERLWLLGVPLFHSEDGGKTWKDDGAKGVHSDHHALWIDPSDPKRMILGHDGGLAQSYDRGKTWDVYQNLPISQFYTVFVDDTDPYRIFGGLQDNGTFATPSVGNWRTGIQEREVFRINGGDGFFGAVDPENPATIYSEIQFGSPSRLDVRTGARKSIRPPRAKGEPKLRCNWMSPLVLSSHNPRSLYFASQRVYRSVDRGDHWTAISPDLTTNDPEKIRGNVPHCTITSLSESPRREGLLWIGTDDGNVQVTLDGGRNWALLNERFPESVRGLWVSRVLASHHEEGRAYVAFSGYREDRFQPYLFETSDYGGTWRDLSHGLPPSPINSVLEDSLNKDFLIVAHDHGVHWSLDGGDSWSPAGASLPKVACHDLAMQQKTGDLVVATHGRGLFVLNVSPLRQWKKTVSGAGAVLFEPAPIRRPGNGFDLGFSGARAYVAQNPDPSLIVSYWLKDEVTEDLVLEVLNANGERVRELSAKKSKGLNFTRFDLRGPRPANVQGRSQGGRTRGQGTLVTSGEYILRLKVGSDVQRVLFWVPPVPQRAVNGIPEEDEEELDSGREFW